MPDVANWIRAYDAGDCNPTELRVAVIVAAAQQAPEEIVGLLRPEHLQAVREAVVTPPSSPEQVRIFRICTVVGNGPSEDSERKEQEAYYRGAWAWHAYFQLRDGLA